MTKTRTRLLKLARSPRSLAPAVARRMFPRSPRYGFPWTHLPDGSVTFHERGFVAASSPSALLARHNYELARLHGELNDLKANRSLEIGCGFGRLSMAIAQHSGEHIAIDINEDALVAARTAYPQIDFRHGGVLSLPFPDRHFDLVVTWTVLQHVRPSHIGAAAAEIKRVLAEDGRLLICEETRDPAGTGGHTWHRTVASYEELLAPLRLIRHGMIAPIAAIPGMESPGEVMVFQP